jgi:Holliday junction DNA helicase RuvA
MIAFLQGRLLEKHPNRIVLDVQGVGYDVQVPLSTFYDLPGVDVPVSLRIHTHVREDQIALFGFATALELQLFERLMTVSGIGPRVALAVLSGIEPADLVRAVRTADVTRLTRIPGVGRKTAERVCLELRDKLSAQAAAAVVGEPGPAQAPEDEMRTDLLSALLNLGYQRVAAEKAVETAMKGSGSGAPPFEQALRAALRVLARG